MEVIVVTDSPNGGAEAEEYSLNPYTTVEQLYKMIFTISDLYRFVMLVNGYPVEWDYELQHGDKVVFRSFRQTAQKS